MEERIRELENRTIEITQSKEQRKNRFFKKINRTSMTTRTITKELTFGSSEFQKEKRKQELKTHIFSEYVKFS